MSDLGTNSGFRVYKSGAAKRKEKSKKEESARILIRNIPTLDNFSFSATIYGHTQSFSPPHDVDETENRSGCDSGSILESLSRYDNEQDNITSSMISFNDPSSYRSYETTNEDNNVLKLSTQDFSQISSPNEFEDIYNINDPAKWNIIDTRTINIIVNNGPPIQYQGPFKYDEEKKRRFTSDNYFSTLKNNERVNRTWLMYSQSLDAVFCLCCKLFNSNSKSMLVTTGFRSWQYVHKTLGDHECSQTQEKSMISWIELNNRLRKNITIDKTTQTLLEMERKHLTSVFERLVAIVLLLSAQNQAFWGSSDALYTPSNGNFLDK